LTTIDFYFNADDRLSVACRLAGKAFAQKKRLLIFVPPGDIARRIDSMLWTQHPLSFIPHCQAHDPLADRTPVLITGETVDPPECEILLNLAPECPPFFERYARLLEIVGQDDADRQLGRSRFKFYKERGYPLGSHDLAARN
jgi:DNA polymerase-3 subunit chi